MKSFASSKSRSGFEPWYEDIMKNLVVGGGGIKGIGDLARKGPAEYFPEDAVSNLTESQLADMGGIRSFGGGQLSDASTLGKAATGLGTVRGQAGDVSRYGQGLMTYGTGATRTGLSQGDYAGYTPFQGAQLESMLAGDVDISKLQAVQDATARQGLTALRPNLAAIRARTGAYQRGGGSGSEKDRRLTEERYTQQMADTWAPLAHQSYERAQERRLPAGQLALSAQLAAQQLGTQGSQAKLGGGGLGLQTSQAAPGIVGAQMGALGQGLSMADRYQAQRQAEIDANMAKWNYEQNADTMQMRNMLGLMGSARVPTVGRGRPSALSSLLNFGTMLSGFV